MAMVRLYVDAPLAEGQPVALTREQAHYLFGVMRLAPGDALLLFDGLSGEWRAEVAAADRRGGELLCRERTRPLAPPPDLWLMFAPVKKARTDLIVEKAVEMGAARILPVLTEFTSAERVRPERLRAHAVEAAEQCGATVVPEVAEAVRLDRLLAGWPAGRRLCWADERGAGEPGAGAGFAAAPAPAALLIGPEGGFSPAERARLGALPFVVRVTLGPRILRADTAAVAAMALWQAAQGDWR
ncbi:MAG: 16S rRNA (uracil(1498)-N(3))-methyltransferase [Rhodobacteraceae bacterium]|nr:16S rRNA (uracil(1498)-N(3))-methyltransferase [Paracoccaceae bacterium]